MGWGIGAAPLPDTWPCSDWGRWSVSALKCESPERRWWGVGSGLVGVYMEGVLTGESYPKK